MSWETLNERCVSCVCVWRGFWGWLSDTYWIVNVQNWISRCPGVIPQTDCKDRTEKQIRKAKRCSNTNHPGLKLYRLNKDCSTCSPLTSQVLVHHIWPMFHKETEHGGAARTALQPEQDWSFISVRLSVREMHTESWDLSTTQWWLQFIDKR